MRRRSEAIKRSEVDETLSLLDSRGTLTETHRNLVESVAASIVDGVLASPEAALERASDDIDSPLAREVAVLFDVDEESGSPRREREAIREPD